MILLNIFHRADFVTGLWETLYMVGLSCLLTVIFGTILGIVLVITGKGGMKENPLLSGIIGAAVNLGRSVPFVIIAFLLIPFARFIVGASFGPSAAVVFLTVAAVPFFARVVEAALKELNQGLIEAAECMGASLCQIIFRVYIKESMPAFIRGIALLIVNLIGYSAMVGAFGGGGLGDIAIRYGYYQYDKPVMLFAVLIIVALVGFIQIIFELTARKINKN